MGGRGGREVDGGTKRDGPSPTAASPTPPPAPTSKFQLRLESNRELGGILDWHNQQPPYSTSTKETIPCTGNKVACLKWQQLPHLLAVSPLLHPLNPGCHPCAGRHTGTEH